MTIPVVIIGCGALGTLFAGLLGEAGQDVFVLDNWGTGIEAIKNSGARYTTRGKVHSTRVFATTDPKDIPPQKECIVLILLKSWQTKDAATFIEKLQVENGICLSLQNGLGNIETLSENIKKPYNITAGVTTLGSTLIQPGLVEIFGKKEISISKSISQQSIAQLFQSAGFNIHIEEDLNSLLWGKLIINAAINPITALLNIKNGQLLEYESLQLLIDQITDESVMVARSLGVVLPDSDAKMVIREVIQKTRENTSSMLQDIKRGAQTEIEAITGKIIQNGLEKGIPTPTNQCIYNILKTYIILQSHPK